MAKKIKYPCQTTRFFWEKVEGKQFHPPYSKCDDFSVRLQIRKRKGYSWNDVAKRLQQDGFWAVFKEPRQCTKTKTKLVASYRARTGFHNYCQWGQVKRKDNWHVDFSDKNWHKKMKKRVMECSKK